MARAADAVTAGEHVEGETAPIRDGIEQTRIEMSRTVNAIEERLSPARLKEQLLEQLHDAKEQVKLELRMELDNAKRMVHQATIGRVETMIHDAGETVHEAKTTMTDTIRRNPIPAAMIGVGLAWLVFNGRAQRDTNRGRNIRTRRVSNEFDEPMGYEAAYMRRDMNPGGHRVADMASDVAHRVGNVAASVQHGVGNAAAGVSQGVSNAAHGVSNVASNLAHGVSNVASNVAHGVSNAASAASQGVGNAAAGVAQGVGVAASTVADRVGTTAAGARDAVSHIAHDARDGAVDLARRAQQGVVRAERRVEQGFTTTMDQNPLVLGALALAIGVGVGLALPATRKENQLLGPARDDLLERAKDAAGDAIERARMMATEASQRAQQSLANGHA